MRVKLLTLSFAPTLGAIDERPLLEFLRDKEVIAVREHFFVVHELPYLACLVTYQDAPMRAAPPPRSGAPREAPAVELPEDADRPLFATLRAWRNEQARKDGVPPYVLFTNAELARIVRARPASLNALGALQGIGPGKVARYGAAILAELHGPPAASAGTAESTPDVPAGEAAS